MNDTPQSEHRCGRCYGPYGKSAILCPNEPPSILPPSTPRAIPHRISDDDLKWAAMNEHLQRLLDKRTA
jgi:hypothetical protein